MTEGFQELSEQSWHDIYATFFETKVIPSTWPQEGIMCSIHHMTYLPQEDVMPLFAEMMGLRFPNLEEE
tara:strand:+ start:2389 stop:2595 length:207 start_codon:yes stop_codon:yes gene_type:complete